jgi:hypothetical protein
MPLPKVHLVVGILITLLLKIFWLHDISWLTMLVIIAANVLIDVDHYMAACFATKRILSLKNAYLYCINQDKTRVADLHLFHTIEFHLFVLIMYFIFLFLLFPIFIIECSFAIFIGMIIHSLVDFIVLTYHKESWRRYYSLIWWLIKKNTSKSFIYK